MNLRTEINIEHQEQRVEVRQSLETLLPNWLQLFLSMVAFLSRGSSRERRLLRLVICWSLIRTAGLLTVREHQPAQE